MVVRYTEPPHKYLLRGGPYDLTYIHMRFEPHYIEKPEPITPVKLMESHHFDIDRKINIYRYRRVLTRDGIEYWYDEPPHD